MLIISKGGRVDKAARDRVALAADTNCDTGCPGRRPAGSADGLNEYDRSTDFYHIGGNDNESS